MSPIVVSTWQFGLSSNQPAWKILKNGGSALDAVVEHMRHGKSPQEACEAVVQHLIARVPSARPYQMAYIAIDNYGNWGAAAARSGFLVAVTHNAENQLHKSRYFIIRGGVG